jgi:hypothetical protein
MAMMRPQDERVFEDAARTIGVWILVRRTKPAALAYIGLAGYAPKPIHCKAKTADSDLAPHKLAGLVTSPKVHPEAFNAAKRAHTLQLWTDFEREHLHPGSPFALEMNLPSRHYGCVKLNGKYIHADYDLYDIILPDQAFQSGRRRATAGAGAPARAEVFRSAELHQRPHRRGNDPARRLGAIRGPQRPVD